MILLNQYKLRDIYLDQFSKGSTFSPICRQFLSDHQEVRPSTHRYERSTLWTCWLGEESEYSCFYRRLGWSRYIIRTHTGTQVRMTSHYLSHSHASSSSSPPTNNKNNPRRGSLYHKKFHGTTDLFIGSRLSTFALVVGAVRVILGKPPDTNYIYVQQDRGDGLLDVCAECLLVLQPYGE